MAPAIVVLILASFASVLGSPKLDSSETWHLQAPNENGNARYLTSATSATARKIAADAGLVRRFLQSAANDETGPGSPADETAALSAVPYNGLADILIGMADPVPEQRIASLRTWNGSEAALVVTSGTMARAPHVMQITLLGPASAAEAVLQTARSPAASALAQAAEVPTQPVEADGAQLQWAESVTRAELAAGAMPAGKTLIRRRQLQGDTAPVASSPNLSPPPPAGTVLHLMVPPLSEAADVFRTSMRGVPVQGVIVDGHAFVMAPEITPACAALQQTEAQGSTDDLSGLACSIGGRSESFATAAEARQALLQAVAEGAARAYDEQAVAQPLPLGLQRRLNQRLDHDDQEAIILNSITSPSNNGTIRSRSPPHLGRQTYVSPVFSRGGRVILGVRTIFSGQQESAVITEADATALLSTASAELVRSAMGAATFAYRIAPSVVTLPPSLPLCSSSYAAIETAVKAALPLQGVAATTYTHLAVLLPDCPPENIPWQGLGKSLCDTSPIPGRVARCSLAYQGLVRGVIVAIIILRYHSCCVFLCRLHPGLYGVG